jgi:uncharacterized protein GlcG (DUF336 family)
MENSFRKAYTSRTFRIPSGEFAQRIKDNPTNGQVQLANVIAARGALRQGRAGQGRRSVEVGGRSTKH